MIEQFCEYLSVRCIWLYVLIMPRKDSLYNSQKILLKFQQFQLPAVFNFHEWQIEYLQVLAVQRRFCQLQINSPVLASLYIYKLKTNGKF